MSVKTIARIIGSLVAIAAVVSLYFLDQRQFPGSANDRIWWVIGIAAASALFMFLITPYITVVPYHWMRNTSASDLLAAVIGLIVGLIISLLLAIPLSNLPANLGHILPFVGAVVFSFLGVAIAVQRKSDILHLFQTGFIPRRARERDREREEERNKERERVNASQFQAVTQILLDTSAIIDGRIADISQTGFISGALLVPRFVLNELQRIADSADTMRRNRGRRGLEMLNRLQKEATVPIEITDTDVEDVVEV